MESSPHFIIIDDGTVDIFITREVIRRYSKEADVEVFLQANVGLEYIKSEYSKPGEVDTILFLDLNMPLMSGWDFLENFEKLNDGTKKLFKIFVLSSFTNNRDRERALSDKT